MYAEPAMIFGMLAVATAAFGHGLDAEHLTVEVEGAAVRVTATPGLVALGEHDRDGDGRLNRAEVGDARIAIRRRFTEAFGLSDLAAGDARCDDVSVSTVGEGEGHVRVSLRCAFRARPHAVVVRYDLPSASGVHVEAVRVERVAPNRWLPEGEVERRRLPAGGGLAVVLGPPECEP